MKNAIISVLLVLFTMNVFAQKTLDVGVGLGAITPRGDMVKYNLLSSFRPEISAWGRYNLTYRISFTGGLNFGWLAADGETDIKNIYGTNDYKFSRTFVEFLVRTEFNWKKYEVGNKRMKFSPFLAIGISAFFSPNGGHVSVLPIPESYGFIDMEHNVFTPTIPVSLGFKWNLRNWWSLSLEGFAAPTFDDELDNLNDPFKDCETCSEAFATDWQHNNEWLFGLRVVLFYQILRTCRQCPKFY